jgi:hypothetical protein
MDWRPNASKMVVLIADAPPHGIGEYGDGRSLCFFLLVALLAIQLLNLAFLAGFDDGSPDGHDPLQIAREMASRGITLVSLADDTRSV